MDWPFTGRGGELDRLTTLLSGDGGYAGAAIVGGAGVGKTRLAREAAGVAARRGFAVRTVEGHIYRACAKLGIVNRAELATLIGGQSRS